VLGLTWPVPEEIDDAELERRLFPVPCEPGPPRAAVDWAPGSPGDKAAQRDAGAAVAGVPHGKWRKTISATMRQKGRGQEDRNDATQILGFGGENPVLSARDTAIRVAESAYLPPCALRALHARVQPSIAEAVGKQTEIKGSSAADVSSLAKCVAILSRFVMTMLELTCRGKRDR
jgi:hypothetical protein